MQTLTFPIALKGLGTEFSIADQPLEYARSLTNRFINLQGAAEKRPGLKKIPSPIDNGFTGNFDCVAEHVNKDGSSTLLTSRINTSANARELFRYDSTAQAWVMVSGALYVSPQNTLTEKAYKVQHTNKSIFVAADVRPSYYVSERDKIYPLNSIIESGKTGSGTTSTVVKDAQVTDWLSQTFIGTNDLLYNASKNAYGIVTSVGTGNFDVTAITSAAAGGTGLGLAANAMASGDVYEVWDLVELNIIPTGAGIDNFDNVAQGTTGTSTDVIAVSGLSFQNTEIRTGDYVYNTTRAAVSQVNAVSANINTTSVSGQTSGDSFVFLKSAVPIATYAHVHYGRLYLVDQREPNKIRVSIDGDPTDFTTFAQTLESNTINYGGRQPQGEEILTLGTFQSYLVAGGKHNVYVDQGTNPIADTSTATTNLLPVGLFSQGVVSRTSLANIGSDMLFGAQDGLRQFRVTNILAVDTNNISETIKTQLRTAINSQSVDPDNIQVIPYPRRNWVMFKVGNEIFNFNYTPTYVQGQLLPGGSFSVFTGLLPQCNEFTLKSDGTLLTAYYDTSANASTFYEFDTGAYTDDTQDIVTDYQTAWLNLDGGQTGGIVKDGRYIKPFFENNSNQNYNITATSDLDNPLLCDTVSISALGGSYVGNAIVGTDPVGGSRTTNTGKYPLRWRGEQVQVRFTTSAGNGADVISKFVLYTNEFGRR